MSVYALTTLWLCEEEISVNWRKNYAHAILSHSYFLGERKGILHLLRSVDTSKTGAATVRTRALGGRACVRSAPHLGSVCFYGLDVTVLAVSLLTCSVRGYLVQT